MCLSIVVHEPERMLGQGNHGGHEWVVVHNDMGFRCGYVKVEPGHPWHGVSYHDIEDEVSVHGGLTFSEPDEPCATGGEDNGWWLGFDCGHGGDAPDRDLMSPGHRELAEQMEKTMSNVYRTWANTIDPRVIRDQEYVEAQCRSLCEQARAAATAS